MNYRVIVIPVVGVILVLAGFLIFGNLNRNLVYYLTPAEAVAQKVDMESDQRFRLGGLVQDGSVTRTKTQVRFTLVADGAAVPVRFTGVPAQLFASGVGTIVEGTWRGDNFYADTMIVKHDENYTTPEKTAGPSDGGVEQ